MLREASAINGCAIEATDGRIGAVSDLLFEDVGWAARWLVVDTGHWLPGRQVLLPPSVLGTPDGALRHFPVNLTMQQIKDSPDVDTAQPVSRQIETHVFDYYGRDPYWLDSLAPISNAIATPFAAPLEAPDYPPGDIDSAALEFSKGDPHLRSIAAVTGYQVLGTDGEVGHIKDFLVDDAGWSIRYIVVDTGDLLPGKQTLIAPAIVGEIDWENGVVHVSADRHKIKDAPRFDRSKTMDRAFDDAVRAYFGIATPAA